MKRIAIHFARLGPYHVARMESAAEVLGPVGWRVVALETAGKDSTYLWEKTDSKNQTFERLKRLNTFSRLKVGRKQSAREKILLQN